MKKLILLLLIFWMSNVCLAQKTMIDFQVSPFTTSALNFNWISDVTNKSDHVEPTHNFSIALNSQVYKFIYLKTEFGVKSANNFVDITFPADPMNGYIGDVKWYGWYENTRVYMAFIPEIRFLYDAVFINAGVIVGRDVVNGFTNGYRDGYGTSSNLKDLEAIKNNSYGHTFNFGLNLMVNNIGFIFGAGYTSLSPVYVTKGAPRIGISMPTVNIGVNYKIR